MPAWSDLTGAAGTNGVNGGDGFTPLGERPGDRPAAAAPGRRRDPDHRPAAVHSASTAEQPRGAPVLGAAGLRAALLRRAGLRLAGLRPALLRAALLGCAVRRRAGVCRSGVRAAVRRSAGVGVAGLGLAGVRSAVLEPAVLGAARLLRSVVQWLRAPIRPARAGSQRPGTAGLAASAG